MIKTNCDYIYIGQKTFVTQSFFKKIYLNIDTDQKGNAEFH